jgi:peptide/nickel transport system permease protein
MAHGNFGNDFFGQPVLPTLLDRVPRTLILVGFSFLLQEVIALPLGILAALKRSSILDRVVTLFTYLGLSLPAFWLSLILILIFAVKLAWLPPGGVVNTLSSDPVVASIPEVGSPAYWTYVLAHPLPTLADLLYHLILPALTLAFAGIAADSRLVRSAMIREMATDYVRTARTKGLPRRKVVVKHALRNALLPVITNAALFIPALFSGAVVVETMFGWQGIGQFFIAELRHRDFNALLIILLLTGLVTLVANLVADLTYGIVDPRIQYE